MSLPYDYARCIGRQVEAFSRQCEKRDTCLRYLDIVPGVDHWYDMPQIPGPCSAYLPKTEGANPMTCRHLLAPLQADEDLCKRMGLRNWRKCATCGEPLWDDGSPMAYLGTGDEAATPPPDQREGVPPSHPLPTRNTGDTQ